MKQIFKKDIFSVVGKMLLFMMAILMGGNVAMAVTVGENGSDDDPNDGTALEDATGDKPGMGIDQQGHGSTGSAMEEAELDDSIIEEYVTKFEAFKYPLHSDYMTMAKKRTVKTKKPKHPVIGEAVLEAYTKSAITNTDKAHEITLPLYANDVKIFQESTTIRVFGMNGYDEEGNAAGGILMLYVIANSRTSVTVIAVNGPKNDSGETYVPDIPAGTKLRAMASALSESEVEVAPDNFMPGFRQAYLQKKACAITRTEFYDRMKKLVAFGGQQVKDAVLSTYRRKCTSTLLCGVPGVMTKYGSKNTGEEHLYMQEGIITQLQNAYQLNGLPTVADLIAICRMMFTKYAKSNRAQAYCGSLFMEWLSNMDFSKHPEISFDSKRDKLNVKVGTFETNFGTLEFKLDYGLDENELSGNAMIFPMSEAIRYIYETKTISIDHAKGEGGEVRQAKSEYYIVDDCLMLTGLNSIFVGQDVSAAGSFNDPYGTKFISVKSITGITTPTKGMVVYLTEEESSYKIGPYIYNGTKWEPFSGEVKA